MIESLLGPENGCLAASGRGEGSGGNILGWRKRPKTGIDTQSHNVRLETLFCDLFPRLSGLLLEINRMYSFLDE